jgi:hypothetical protein
MGSPETETLRSDMRERPRAFYWYGAIAAEPLRDWIEQRQLDVPSDLLDLWQSRGGGVIFESEEVLAPWGGDEHAIDFDESNHAHRTKGLPEGMFVFHEGSWISAVRPQFPRYVALEHSTYAIAGEFESLDDWYRGTIRKEFAERYHFGTLV